MVKASERVSALATRSRRLDTVSAIESRQTTYLVEGRNGKMPWSWARLALYVALPLFLLLALVATPWAVAHIEGQLVDDAEADLTAAGIDPSGLDIDFDYRDGEAIGTLPSGITAERAELAVDDGLLRDFVVRAESVASASIEPDDDAEATSATGGLEVDLEADDATIELTGTVLDEGQRSTIVEAVTAANPTATIDDRLVVTGLPAATDGAGARIDGLVAAIEELEDRIDAVPTTVTVTALAPEPTSEPDDAEVAVSSLQAELDALIPEIRENVVFASGSDVLTATASATLDKVVAAMAANPGPVVDVTGHTDDVGNREANVELSERRAASVVAYLIEAGTDPDRLRSTGLGPDEPIDSNETSAGRAVNRRVELTAAENF